MKTTVTNRFRSIVLKLPLVLAFAGPSNAATWTGATSGSWATAGNWTGTPPDNTTPQAVVYDAASALNLSQTLNASYSVTGITQTSPSGAVIVANGTGTGNILTLGSGGVDMSAATQNLTLGANLSIGASQTWSVAGGRTLTGIAGTTTSVGTGTGNINMVQSGTGTATIVFNQNGNGTGWSGYAGNITVNANVKVQSQGQNFAAFGSGGITLAGGQIAQNNGTWAWSNNIDVTAASVIGTDSSNGLGRALKLLGNLTSSNSSGLTFSNNTTGGTRTDNSGFILAGTGASTYTTTTISANSRVRVGGNATNSMQGTNPSHPGDRGSLGSGDVTLAAANSELAFTRTVAQTVANKITGLGTVVIGGNTNEMAGTNTQVVTLSGAHDYTGGTRISRSRLHLTGTLTSALTVDNSGSISGTGGTDKLLTLASTGRIALAGGATTTSITSNGATFGGSNIVTFLTAPVDTTVYDVLTYGAGAVTTPENLTVPYRGTLADDPTNKKYTFTAGEFGATRTWNTTSGAWAVNTGTNFVEGDQKFFAGDHVIFPDITSDSTITLTAPILPGSVTVSNAANRYTLAGGAMEGATSLTKSGAGSLDLSVANTHTGGTTLSQGTLIVSNAGALGTSGPVTLNDANTDGTNTTLLLGNLNLARPITVANQGSGTVTLGVNGTQALPTFSGAITLNKDVNLDGTGNTDRLTFTGGIGGTGNVTITGGANRVVLATTANTYSGATTVSANSILQLGTGTDAANHIPDASVLTLNSGSLLKLAKGANSETIGGLAGSGTVRGHEAVASITSSLVINGGTDQSFEGVLENGGATGSTLRLTKDGAGTQALTGINTYTGTTTVSGGTLKISGAGVLGNGTYPGAIGNSATLHFDSSANQTLSGLISGAGTLLKSGSGTLILTNNNDGNTGTVTVSEGTLQIGNNNTAGFIGNSATVVNNAAMVWHRSNATNVANAISGSGTVTKLGTSTLNLYGHSTYEGATTVTSGTLTVSGSLGNTAVTVQTGATLAGSGGIAGQVTIESGGIHSLAVAATPAAQVTRTIGGTLTLDAGNILTLTAAAPPAAGTYILATASGGIIGDPGTVNLPNGVTGSVAKIDNDLVLTVTSGYGSWQTANGTTQAIGQDHDHDGVPNGVEFFIGGPNSTTGFTALPTVVNDNGAFKVSWTKHADYTGVYGTDFVIETSDTLAGAWTQETLGGNVSQSGNSFTYTFPAPLGAKKFVRLVVTGPQ